MDNFQIDVTAEGRESLSKALEIAFEHNASGPAKSFQVVTLKSEEYNHVPKDLDGKTAFVFRWAEKQPNETSVSNLPFKLDAAGATEFATRWLAEQDYGDPLDHDGSNGKGWRVFIGFWGHLMEDRYAICAVIPWWAWYGK